jgi:hypothetical protein
LKPFEQMKKSCAEVGLGSEAAEPLLAASVRFGRVAA